MIIYWWCECQSAPPQKLQCSIVQCDSSQDSCLSTSLPTRRTLPAQAGTQAGNKPVNHKTRFLRDLFWRCQRNFTVKLYLAPWFPQSSGEPEAPEVRILQVRRPLLSLLCVLPVGRSIILLGQHRGLFTSSSAAGWRAPAAPPPYSSYPPRSWMEYFCGHNNIVSCDN